VQSVKSSVAVVDLSGTLHEAKVHAVTVNSDNSYTDFVYSISEENGAPTPIYADINRGDFVYELSPAVMKAAPLRLISERYGLHKFHANTHVYFSHDLKIDVPAEVWQVEEIITVAVKNDKASEEYVCKDGDCGAQLLV